MLSIGTISHPSLCHFASTKLHSLCANTTSLTRSHDLRAPKLGLAVASVDQLITSSSQPDGGEAAMSEECANPLLLGWIKEWLDQARERNSKGVTVWVSRVLFALAVLLMPS